MAAVTLAQRVAAERGTTVGGIVGYRIGHDACASKDTRMTFVTTGWLLQYLVATAADDSDGLRATHIVLDEAHERSIDVDLVLLVVKLAVAKALAARAKAVAALAAAAAARGNATGAALAEAATAALTAYANRCVTVSVRFVPTLTFLHYCTIMSFSRLDMTSFLISNKTIYFYRRPRIVIMSATISTQIFESYFAPLAADLDRALPADSPAAFLQLAKLLPSMSLVATGAVPKPPAAAVAGLLGALLRDDTPPTLEVGAKRYPVATVWLEGVYKDPAMLAAGLGRSEAQQVDNAVKAFDKAVVTWKAKSASGPPPGGVAESVVLPDVAQAAILKLVARVAIAAARPGTGDAILVFVPGLADIDKVCQAFLEVAPGKVAAPPAKVGAPAAGGGGDGEDDGCDDEDLLALNAAASAAHRGQPGRGLVDDEDSDDEDEEDGNAPATLVAAKPAVPAPAPPSDGRSTIRLVPMHSLLSQEDQLAAFGTGDPRTRVVVATNIAESSLTIPGVTTVIDLGRAKTVEYVPKLGAPALRTTWVSQASAQQRAGRAGRLCAGTCYRMYTRGFHDGVMPRYDTPEMLRLALDSVCLKVKMLGLSISAQGNLTAAAVAAAAGAAGAGGPKGAPGAGKPAAAAPAAPAESKGTSAKAVLNLAIQSPDVHNVDAALGKLAALGALTSSADEAEVTPFGRMLASFPGDLSLGKLVAVGAALGAAADAIVLAAALASGGDVFLMPHAAVAASHGEYTALVGKVVRAKWALGRDAVLAGGDPACASAASEPITWRNAYLAWRATPARDRAGWCISAGIVARRMTGMHSLVREIAHRVARDVPALAGVTAQLLSGDDRGNKAGGGRGGAGGEGSWPPPGLFTPNTHVLRLLLLASHAGGLCVGDASYRASSGSHLAGLGLDPARSLTLRLGPATPPAWLDSLSVRGIAQAPPKGSAPPAGAAAGKAAVVPFRPFVGDLARSLGATGIVSTGGTPTSGAACVTGVVGDARGAAGGGRGGGSRAVGVEFSADYDVQPPGLRVPGGPVRDLLAGPAPVAPAPAAAGQAAAPARVAPSSVASMPLLRALPVAAVTLLQLAGPRQELALPPVAADSDVDAALARETGARRFVPGMGPPQSSSPSPGQQQPGGLVPAECASAFSLSWKTTSSLSGRTAFAGGPAGGQRASAGGAGTESDTLTAKPGPQSSLRYAVDAAVPPAPRPAAQGQQPPPPPPPLPLLAVSSALQLQERAGGGGGGGEGARGGGGSSNVTAVMTGSTVLWRDASTLALALLIVGRGIEVLLEWRGGNVPGGPPAVVVGVKFAPRSASPLHLAPTLISAADLVEVNAVRSALSAQLGAARLGLGSAPASPGAGSPLLSRMMALLRLDDSGRAPRAQAPPSKDPLCASVVADHAKGPGMRMDTLLPHLCVGGPATPALAAGAAGLAKAMQRLAVAGPSASAETSDEEDDSDDEDDSDSDEDEDDDSDSDDVSPAPHASRSPSDPVAMFGLPARGSATGARAESLLAGPGGRGPVGGGQDRSQATGGSGGERKAKGGERKGKEGGGKKGKDGAKGGKKGEGKKEGGKKEKGAKGDRGKPAKTGLAATLADASTKTDRERRAAEVTAERNAAAREKEDRLAANIGSGWDKLQAKMAAAEKEAAAKKVAAAKAAAAPPAQPRPATAAAAGSRPAAAGAAGSRPASAAQGGAVIRPGGGSATKGWGGGAQPPKSDAAFWPTLGK